LNFEEEDSASSGVGVFGRTRIGFEKRYYLKTPEMKRMMRIFLFSVVTRVLAKSGVQQKQ
jgi:hypothetical protein